MRIRRGKDIPLKDTLSLMLFGTLAVVRLFIAFCITISSIISITVLKLSIDVFSTTVSIAVISKGNGNDLKSHIIPSKDMYIMLQTYLNCA